MTGAIFDVWVERGPDLVIREPRDARVTELIRELRGRCWEPSRRVWLVPVEHVKAVVAIAEEFRLSLHPEVSNPDSSGCQFCWHKRHVHGQDGCVSEGCECAQFVASPDAVPCMHCDHPPSRHSGPDGLCMAGGCRCVGYVHPNPLGLGAGKRSTVLRMRRPGLR